MPTKFIAKDKLTKEQRQYIESFKFPASKRSLFAKQNSLPKPKRHYTNYYNPNDYIQISPAEIERQGKAALEAMRSFEWRDENVKANKLPGLSDGV